MPLDKTRTGLKPKTQRMGLRHKGGLKALDKTKVGLMPLDKTRMGLSPRQTSLRPKTRQRQDTDRPKPKTQQKKDSKIKQKWATRMGQPLKKLLLKKNSIFLKIFILKETLFLKTQFDFFFFYLQKTHPFLKSFFF